LIALLERGLGIFLECAVQDAVVKLPGLDRLLAPDVVRSEYGAIDLRGFEPVAMGPREVEQSG